MPNWSDVKLKDFLGYKVAGVHLRTLDKQYHQRNGEPLLHLNFEAEHNSLSVSYRSSGLVIEVCVSPGVCACGKV